MNSGDTDDQEPVLASEVLDANNRDLMPAVLRDVLDYWESVRTEGFAPRWADFDLDKLSPEIIPWCIVADVVGKNVQDAEFKYRFWGSARTRLVGMDLTGKTIRDMPRPDMVKALMADYREVCQIKSPLLLKKIVTFEIGDAVEFISLKAPLSDTGERVDNVLVVSYYPDIDGRHYTYYKSEPPISIKRWRLDP